MNHFHFNQLTNILTDLDNQISDIDFATILQKNKATMNKSLTGLEHLFYLLLIKDYQISLDTLFKRHLFSNASFTEIFIGSNLFFLVLSSDNELIRKRYIDVLKLHYIDFSSIMHPVRFLGIQIHEKFTFSSLDSNQIEFCSELISNAATHMPLCFQSEFYRPAVKSFFVESFYSNPKILPVLTPLLDKFSISPVDFFTSIALSLKIKNDNHFTSEQISFFSIPDVYSYLFKNGQVPASLLYLSKSIILTHPDKFL